MKKGKKIEREEKKYPEREKEDGERMTRKRKEGWKKT